MLKKRFIFSSCILVVAFAIIMSGISAFVPGTPLYRGIFGANNGASIASYYDYGTQFVVPEHKIDSVSATAVVTYPDGTTTSESEITLDQAGSYGVTYSATVGGQVKSEQFSFSVKYPIATGLKKSTGYYGTSPYGNASDTPGYFASLDSSDTLVFSQIIDLRGATKENYFVDLFPTPASPGSSDCEQFWITLTDIENPESYLMVRMNLYTEGTRQTMTLATRSNAQSMVVGREASKNYVHVGNQYGSYPGVEMNGSAHGVWERDGAINTLKLSYEESTKTVWSSNKWNMLTIIADLDDPDYVGESLWTGFTSGKVRMSFYAKGYMSEKANFVFKSIGGQEFSNGGIDDTVAPVIEVQQPSVNGAVGGEYDIPKCVVTDNLSPIVKQEVSVSKDGNQVEVVDGKFVTATAGNYEVTYTAYDAFMNKAEQKITVTVDTAPAVVVADVDLNQSYNRGEKVVLPDTQVTGGRGETTLCVYATFNGQQQKLTDRVFVPMSEGEYTITYQGKDAVGQKTIKENTVTVVNGSQPVFRDEPKLPNYLLSAFSYRAPELYAYDYSSGEEKKVVASLTVTDASGTKSVDANNGFIPLVNKNLDEVSFTWKAGETTLTRTVKTIFALSGEEILTENYFIGNATVDKGSDYMEITANGKNDEWTFVNTLIAESFSLNLTAMPTHSNFDALEIVLRDANDPTVSVTARITAEDNYRSSVTIGNRKALVSKGFDIYSVSNKFAFVYNNGIFSIGTAQIVVDKDDNGNDFTSFPSEEITVSVRFVNASAGAKYRITNLCGQPLGVLLSDRVRPSIKILGNYGGTQEIGSVITVPKMIARDVLNPSVITFVTVKDTNGNYIVADDGTVLNRAVTSVEYTFTAEKYGQYQFEYAAHDSFSGRETKMPFVVSVFDDELPQASFVTEPITSVKVGELIVIPDLKVSDNITTEENILINRCIVSPTGKVFHLAGAANAMRAMYAGVYTIRVLVCDEAGNITMLTCDVTVTE